MLDSVSGRLLSPVFVGRGPELVMLREQLADAAAGQPGVVVLGGDAGVGKTRLVDEFVREVRDEAQVVVGGCLDLGDNGLAFTPFVAVLRDLVRQLGAPAVTALLGPGRLELTALVPELAGPDDDTSDTGPASDLLRLYEAVTDLLERASQQQPLVVVLEDLHWADRSSRDLLSFLARTLRNSRVLVVATYRADDLHRTHPLRPFLAELDRVRGVTRLTLASLDRDEVAAQMAPLLGRDPTPDELDRVYERSEGNPLFVEELACCFPQSGLPDSLRDLLMIRTERLDRPARQVLQVAAVIGSRVHYPLIAAVGELPEAELAEGLRAAVEANILVADTEADAFAFRHSLLRDAVHDDVLPGEHTRLHARIAQVLTDSPGLVRADRQPAEVAHHWNAAHDQPRALASAYVAAQQAQHVHAYAEQLQLLERMLGLWSVVPDPEDVAGVDLTTVLRLAVSAASRAGQLDRVSPLADQLVAAATQTGDPLRLADALMQRGKWCADNADSTDVDLRRALDLLPVEPPSKLRARALDTLAMRNLLRGRGDVGEQLAREALEVARAAGATAAEVSAMSTLSTVLVSTDDVEQGLDYARQALKLATDEGNDLVLTRVLTNMSHALCGLGRHEEAVDAARRGLAVTEQLGLTRTFGQMLSGNLADPLVLLGRLDEAESVVASALELGRATASGAAYLVQLAGRIALLRGDLAAAEEFVTEGEQVRSRDRLLLQDWLPLLQLGAALENELGDPEASYARAIAGLTEPLPTDHTRYLWPLLVEAARAVADRAGRARDLHDNGQLEAALADAERVRHLGDQLPVPGASGTAWRAHLHAELDRAHGVDDLTTWEQVVTGYAKVDEVLQVAAARIRMADLAVAGGDRATAHDLLRQATETATSSGAGLLTERARRLARRARIALTEDAADASDTGAEDDVVARFGLTEREHEVLLLVAEGLSNRQIGERLYMSPKTASVHVSAILAKLQVAGRGEAAAVAHRVGLVR